MGQGHRLKTLRLLRHPRWLQAILLPWLPITIILFLVFVPRKYEAVCTRESASKPPQCRLEVTKGIWTRALRFATLTAETDGDTRRQVVFVRDDAGGRQTFQIADPAGASKAYDAFVADPSALEYRWPLTGSAFEFILGAQLAGEIAIVLYLRFAQREIRIDVDPKTGIVRITRTRAEPVELDLGHVAGFVLRDTNATGQAVVATMKEPNEERPLFECAAAEAEHGLAFLDREREQWQSLAATC